MIVFNHHLCVSIFRDLRSKAPTQILLNFCIALSLTLIVFLVAAERSNTSSLGACRAAAIALHYFVLTMFVWTSIQAYNMYRAFVTVIPTYHSKFILKCCVVGWGEWLIDGMIGRLMLLMILML